MDWLCPEKAELRAYNDRLRDENEQLWKRVRALETRLDNVSTDQFLGVQPDLYDRETKKMLIEFAQWVLR